MERLELSSTELAKLSEFKVSALGMKQVYIIISNKRLKQA